MTREQEIDTLLCRDALESICNDVHKIIRERCEEIYPTEGTNRWLLYSRCLNTLVGLHYKIAINKMEQQVVDVEIRNKL